MSEPMPKLEDLVKVPSGGACAKQLDDDSEIACAFKEHNCSHVDCGIPHVIFLTKENYTRWLTAKLTKA